MIGHLYRYPHPYDQTRFIYVGQGAKRDPRHRSGESSFGRRFKRDFPSTELPQPIREQVEIQNQFELNELEIIAMFQYHTWCGYEGGMNLQFPGAVDYKIFGRLGGRIAAESGQLEKARNYPGRKEKWAEIVRTKEGCIKGGKAAGKINVDNGHISALGKIYGGRYADVLKEFRTPEHQSYAGRLGGQKNVESGHIQKLGLISSALGGPLDRARHVRWHVKRSIISFSCIFCQQL